MMAQGKKAKAIQRLEKVLSKVPELGSLQRNSPEFEKWRRNALVAITNTFGSESNHVATFNDIHFSLQAFWSDTPESEFQKAYLRGLDSAKAILESMIEEITEYWKEESSSTSKPRIENSNSTNKVFVIHGHNESVREKVARFLEKLELKPIVLHEQPNKGRTIIEKFEEYGDVGFAVVLLTPDDVGALKEEQADSKPRARQNVVFEFGYFIGKLGRERVCALSMGNVEKPSDCDGILYVPLDDEEGWKMRLMRELKAAKFNVDANKLISSSDEGSSGRR